MFHPPTTYQVFVYMLPFLRDTIINVYYITFAKPSMSFQPWTHSPYQLPKRDQHSFIFPRAARIHQPSHLSVTFSCQISSQAVNYCPQQMTQSERVHLFCACACARTRIFFIAIYFSRVCRVQWRCIFICKSTFPTNTSHNTNLAQMLALVYKSTLQIEIRWWMTWRTNQEWAQTRLHCCRGLTVASQLNLDTTCF